MERVSLHVHGKGRPAAGDAEAKTATGWLTMGFHEDLEEAMWMALQGMLDWMSSLYGLSRTEAYAYASLAVDLRITQIVNSVKGVHALLPYDALR